MHVILGGKYNLYSAVFSASAKTLVISNCVNFDLTAASMVSVYNTTHAGFFGQNALTCVKSVVAGLPVFTFQFQTVPSSSADIDTLVIILDIPENQSVYSILAYSASKV